MDPRGNSPWAGLVDELRTGRKRPAMAVFAPLAGLTDRLAAADGGIILITIVRGNLPAEWSMKDAS